MWINLSAWPDCETCGRPMRQLLQLSSNAYDSPNLLLWFTGFLHVFRCPEHLAQITCYLEH